MHFSAKALREFGERYYAEFLKLEDKNKEILEHSRKVIETNQKALDITHKAIEDCRNVLALCERVKANETLGR